MNNLDKILVDMYTILDELRKEKDLVKDNPTKARALAVTITELEKTAAYYEKYVVS